MSGDDVLRGGHNPMDACYGACLIAQRFRLRLLVVEVLLLLLLLLLLSTMVVIVVVVAG